MKYSHSSHLFVIIVLSYLAFGLTSRSYAQEVVHDTVYSFDVNAEVIPSYHEVDTDCSIYLINGRTFYGNYDPVIGWRFVAVSQKKNKTKWKTHPVIHHYHTISKFREMPKKSRQTK